MILSVYLRHFLILQSQKGDNFIGQIIQVIQSEVEFVSSTKKHWLFALLNH